MRAIVVFCLSLLVYSTAGRADSFSFGFSTTSSIAGSDCVNSGGCAAGVTVTTFAGQLEVQLESFGINPTSPGQLVSGVFITLGTTPTSDSLFSQKGQLIDISGKAATDQSGDPTHWNTSKSGATICFGDCGNLREWWSANRHDHS